MKQVATRARPRCGGGFLVIHEHELDVLDSLPLWMTRLFAALVRCSNFRTGVGQASYAGLLLMLTPLQPRHGPRHYVPDAQAIRKALVRFEQCFIVGRHTDASQAGESLFFELAPRGAQVRPTPELEGGTRMPPTSLESEHRRGF